MPEHNEIYARHAAEYERLVSREDYQGNILRALRAILPLPGLEVIEMGAGTGRLTCLLAPLVASIAAFDLSAHMLALAQARLRALSLHNWRLAVSDHRRLPVRSAAAGLVISGWSVCYLKSWGGDGWQAQVARALAEMRRAARPGGWLILLETLGTGNETPQPPPELRPYYDYLESQGFQRAWIRTDYRFPSRAEAEQTASFFFGAASVERLITAQSGVILPECTGVWRFRMAD
jgi:ubiquinone/menaquinone biosynthesis C-methylase UbiE